MTMTLNTLDDLLKSLEKQASEDESAKKDEEKKEEDKKKSDEAKGKELPWDKKKDDEKSEDRVKEAQLQGAALANEIMQKVASANIPTQKETSMNTAQFAGQALAQSLLEKLASAGDMSTTNGVFPGALPNKAQIDNAQRTAEQDAIVAPTPTKNSMGNGGGSVNQIFDAIVAKAMGQGAVAHDQITQTGIAASEGAVEAHAVPNGVPSTSDAVEKVAAVSALVNSGFDFDQAVSMVKAAEEEIKQEEAVQVKQAAMNELLDAGVDFALAAALVKQAGLPAIPTTVKIVKPGILDAAKSYVGAHKGAIAGGVAGGYVAGRLDGTRARDRAAAHAQEKQAALNGLMEAGMDFDTAAALVAETSQELYGA